MKIQNESSRASWFVEYHASTGVCALKLRINLVAVDSLAVLTVSRRNSL